MKKIGVLNSMREQLYTVSFNLESQRQGRGLRDYAESAKWWLYSITPCSPFGGAANLIASPLPIAPLMAAGLLAAGLLALQYSARFDGMLGFCCSVVVLLNLFIGLGSGALALGYYFSDP